VLIALIDAVGPHARHQRTVVEDSSARLANQASSASRCGRRRNITSGNRGGIGLDFRPQSRTSAAPLPERGRPARLRC
jgi:hypothetical protein